MSIFLTIIGFFSTIVFGVMSLVGLIKKSGKAKRRGIYTIASIILFIIGVTTIHPSSEPVSTNVNESKATQTEDSTPATTTPQQATPAPSDVKDFNAAVSQTVNGLNINIAEVKIEKDKVSIGMSYQNTSGQKISFFPDQGSVVIGDMQLEANTFLGSRDMGGDINAGVKKDGVIVFEVPEGKSIDIPSVTEIKLNLGKVFNDSYTDTQDANISVPVK